MAPTSSAHGRARKPPIVPTGPCVPGRELGRVPPGDPSADETLGEVSARDVEMPENAAEFAGREQPGDRLAERVEHPLLAVVYRSAVRVRADRPDVGMIERRRGDLDH